MRPRPQSTSAWPIRSWRASESASVPSPAASRAGKSPALVVTDSAWPNEVKSPRSTMTGPMLGGAVAPRGAGCE